MIFGIFALCWIYFAISAWMLIPPIILLTIREFYLDRGLRFKVLWIPLVVASLFLIFFLGVSKKPLSESTLEAGKIFASGFILIHLTYGALIEGPSYMPIFGTSLLLIQRCLILEKGLVKNALYSFKMRRHHSGIFSREMPSLMNGLILTATWEFLNLAEDLRRLYKSRGSHPVTKGWVVPRARKIPVTLGDILLVISIGIVTNLGLSQFTPHQFIEMYAWTFR